MFSDLVRERKHFKNWLRLDSLLCNSQFSCVRE